MAGAAVVEDDFLVEVGTTVAAEALLVVGLVDEVLQADVRAVAVAEDGSRAEDEEEVVIRSFVFLLESFVVETTNLVAKVPTSFSNRRTRLAWYRTTPLRARSESSLPNP